MNFMTFTPRPTRSAPQFHLRRQTFFTANKTSGRRTGLLYRLARQRKVNISTGAAGEEQSGHISAGPNEGILFFDNIFPLKLQWLMRLPWNADKSLPELLKRFNSPNVAAADPLSVIKRALPPSLPVKVTEIVPRVKDGGAFVKFTHPEGIESSEIEGTIRGYLQEKPIKPWFSPFQSVRGFLVKGRPWIEDLYTLPSSRLKVEFTPTSPGAEATELSQEKLYSLFRKYGKLSDIVAQPPGSKDLPKFAYLNFIRVRQAITAKNCMHGFILSEAAGGGKAGTRLRLTYEQRIKAHYIRDWIMNHPRIVIPAVAVLVTTITVAIFDPIRTFFVKAHVSHAFHFTNLRIYRWFKSQAADILTFRQRQGDEVGLRAIWEDRKGDIEQIKTWLIETADTFIVVQGPRGSGKRELVIDQALKDRKYKLVIDCKPIQEARGDSSTIAAAARSVGYRPVFSSMNSVSSLIDLAAQGTIGTKAGFSETLDTQLAKIWQTTAVALKQIALEDKHKDKKEAALSDDDYLEAHPERRPVVVIDNFLHKSQESSLVYDKISEWAAGLVQSNIAHVIFLTHDVSFSKSLSKALPDRVFRQISLGDCTPEVAKRFVFNHLDAESNDGAESGEEKKKKLSPSQRRDDLDELDACIEVLGGRLTDLEFFARRLKAGESPRRAVHEITEQSASEILKMYIVDVDRGQREWSPEQAWMLIKDLASKDSLRYNEILLSPIYASGGEQALQALEQAELISIIAGVNGRPYAIKPGKPVYQAAFKMLTEDRVLQARLDLSILSALVKAENASIDKYETELSMLGQLPKQPAELADRIKWLLVKLHTSQANVEKFELQSGVLKKILQVEF